ncbi:MAG: HAD family hydrolase [Candidatus Aenigmatarchaeota archaeon]
MKLKAVFFDVDGTIIPLDVVVKAFKETSEHFNIKPPKDKKLLKDIKGLKLIEAIRKAIPEARPIEKEFAAYFEKIQIKNFKKYSRLLPYVKTTFREIKKKKIKIGIVTTKLRSEALAVVRGYKLPFDVLIGNDDVKRRKPHPEPVFKACKKLRVKPQECIFVGDTDFDMQAARSAGCVAVGVLTGHGKRNNLKKSGANFIIKDLRELRKLIK